MPAITYQKRSGEPILAKGLRIIPFSKVLQISFPGSSGGFVWNRPVAVRIENENGLVQELPVVDVTRQVGWLFLATCLGLSILLILMRRGSNSKKG